MHGVFNSRYETINKIGSGAFGDLYKAKDLTLDKNVALKVLHASQTTPKQIMRLQSEARILSQMHHRNLVEVFDFSIDECGSPYLVMELIEGSNLSDYVNENPPLELAQCFSIFRQICSGLAYAHNRSILHRDLKPNNIMLAQDGAAAPIAKIVDFGIAKSEGNDNKTEFSISIQHGLLGSPLYMAPEIARGNPADSRSDIYSLGCVFFFILTGKPPFRGDTINDTILMHINDAPPTVSSFRIEGEIPPDLERLIACMLQKNPDRRFHSVEEIEESLENVVRQFEAYQREARVPLLESKPEPRPEVKLKQSIKAAILTVAIIILSSLAYLVIQFIADAQPRTDSDSAVQEHWKKSSKGEFDAGAGNFDAFAAPHLSELSSNFHPYIQEVVHWVRFIGVIDDDKVEELLPEAIALGQYLRFFHKDITGESFAFAKRSAILGLDLTACEVSPKGLSAIADIASVELLLLNKLNTISDNDIASLKKLPNLKFLSLRFDRLSDETAATVSEIETLEGLDLTGNKITDDGLKQILKLKKLKSLGIGETEINHSSLKIITERYHELNGLDLSGLAITDDDLDLITDEPLLCLSLNRNSHITKTGLLKLRKIRTLRYLMLASCDSLDEVSVRQLSIARPDMYIHVKVDVLKAGKMMGKDLTRTDGGDRSNLAY